MIDESKIPEDRKIQLKLITDITKSLGMSVQTWDIEYPIQLNASQPSWWVVNIYSPSTDHADHINEVSARVFSDYIELLLLDTQLEEVFSWSVEFANPNFDTEFKQQVKQAFRFKHLNDRLEDSMYKIRQMVKSFNNNYEEFEKYVLYVEKVFNGR